MKRKRNAPAAINDGDRPPAGEGPGAKGRRIGDSRVDAGGCADGADEDRLRAYAARGVFAGAGSDLFLVDFLKIQLRDGTTRGRGRLVGSPVFGMSP